MENKKCFKLIEMEIGIKKNTLSLKPKLNLRRILIQLFSYDTIIHIHSFHYSYSYFHVSNAFVKIFLKDFNNLR